MRKKENVEETLQPFAASTELECERQEYLTQLSDGFFGWIHQPTHGFDCRTSSGCRCL